MVSMLSSFRHYDGVLERIKAMINLHRMVCYSLNWLCESVSSLYASMKLHAFCLRARHRHLQNRRKFRSKT